jgi:hypothetical protein
VQEIPVKRNAEGVKGIARDSAVFYQPRKLKHGIHLQQVLQR